MARIVQLAILIFLVMMLQCLCPPPSGEIRRIALTRPLIDQYGINEQDLLAVQYYIGYDMSLSVAREGRWYEIKPDHIPDLHTSSVDTLYFERHLKGVAVRVYHERRLRELFRTRMLIDVEFNGNTGDHLTFRENSSGDFILDSDGQSIRFGNKTYWCISGTLSNPLMLDARFFYDYVGRFKKVPGRSF